MTQIRTANAAASAAPTKHDAVVFFNGPHKNYAEEFIDLLVSAKEVGSELIAVAIDRGYRTPPFITAEGQGFDVVDELRRRSLTPEQVETVALCLARTIVARLQPTLTQELMHLFISYRRLDGEDLAAALCAHVRTRAERAFRDLMDIRIGANAQEVIESELRKSDAVLFLDTPRSGESAWVEKELELALGLNLPIVWIRVGPEDGRVPLVVKPAGTPHFWWPDWAAESFRENSATVDQCLHKAFELSRTTARRVFEDLRRMKSFSRENGVQFAEVDRRNMLYSVQIPRPGFRYRQRPMSHLLQFYGRRPTSEDLHRFSSLAVQHGSPRHLCYDAEVLLAPIPEQGGVRSEGDALVIDSSGEYIRSIQDYLNGTETSEAGKRGIIISGAFPDCEPDYQQHVTDAVHAFSEAILERSGVVVFGGHPTFQHLIFDLAKRRKPNDFQKVLHLYLSRFFVTDSLIEELRGKATVIATQAVPGSRAESLTAMRRTMIADSTARALVAIGGKTPAGGHVPGVDEEIEMARAAGLPVFLVGSAGGRTAEIAADLTRRLWVDGLNPLSAEENTALFTRIDYRVMAEEILGHLGL